MSGESFLEVRAHGSPVKFPIFSVPAVDQDNWVGAKTPTVRCAGEVSIRTDWFGLGRVDFLRLQT